MTCRSVLKLILPVLGSGRRGVLWQTSLVKRNPHLRFSRVSPRKLAPRLGLALTLLGVGVLGCGSSEPAGADGDSGSGGENALSGSGGDATGPGGGTTGSSGGDSGSGGGAAGAGGTGSGGNASGSGGEPTGTGGDGSGGMVVFPVPEKPDWTVDTLAALREAIQQSGQTIVMKEGNYDLTELPEGSRNLLFSGSNNTIDLVGVYVEVPVGSTPQESYLTMEGSGNTLVGGIFEDTYTTGLVDVTDYYEYNQERGDLSYGLGGDAVFSVLGSDNLIDGIKLTIRGSFPYGYGSMFGIGRDNTFGLNKRCGIVINGQDNVLDHVEIQQRAFCHGIYMQWPADNTTIRNSLVEGRVRLSAELYDEPADSLPGQLDYMLPDPDDALNSASDVPIPMDDVFSLSEDGIRVYTDGGSVTVENSTVKMMRGGIRLYLATSATVSDSTAIDCGATNFNLPAGGTVTNSSGNFAYSTLNDNRLSRSNQNLEITILPSPHTVGTHNIADILGNNQEIVFHRAPGPLDDDETRAIVVSGNNSTILNETEYHIVIEGDGNDITSAGAVTDNGSNNDVASIPLEL